MGTMSQESALIEQVIEQPDSLVISPPSDLSSYNHIQPFVYLEGDNDNDSKTTTSQTNHNVLLILNQKITIDLISLWNKCEIIVCADGGADSLYEYFSNNNNNHHHPKLQRSDYIPDYIVGDFDSISPDVKAYYQSHGSKTIRQSSEYYNDFTKSIHCIQLHYQLNHENGNWFESVNDVDGLAKLWDSLDHTNRGIDITIYVLNAIGGRFDQTVQSINQLYIMNKIYPTVTVFFITVNDIIFLLKKGVNYVSFTNRLTFHKDDGLPPTCGLLPLSNSTPIALTSYGLKYDMRNWKTEMSGKVSSSNRISGETGFIVECSDDIVMNIEIDV